jgi:cytochrome c peroxidase
MPAPPSGRQGGQAGSEQKGKTPAREPLDPGLAWLDNYLPPLKDDVPIAFVQAETNREQWKKLPEFWNAPPLADPRAAAAVIGLSPHVAPSLLAASPPVIKIKVPLGLDDPGPYVPASNPLTLGKWELGRRLFFDETYLRQGEKESCATCHVPTLGYTDGWKGRGGMNTLSLVNCVYNPTQFWDGRVGRLEEVVQRSLEDEREPDGEQKFRHVWGGVVTRLRKDVHYREQFRNVFGISEPTQDAVGRALATYLRTLLAANSLHDRARKNQEDRLNRILDPSDYEKALKADPKALTDLKREGVAQAEVAAELHRGYLLFHDLEPKKPTHCAQCHGGRNFTDNQFHNLGADDSAPPFGKETGRFPQAPFGEKSRYLIGAFRTPTLRNLPRTGPYLHTGEVGDLKGVVEFHLVAGAAHPNLDPELRDPKDAGERRKWNLEPADVDALVLFLRALNGDEVDGRVRAKPPPLEEK